MSATDPARLTTPERTAEDADAALRPKSLDEFIGQQAASYGRPDAANLHAAQADFCQVLLSLNEFVYVE